MDQEKLCQVLMDRELEGKGGEIFSLVAVAFSD